MLEAGYGAFAAIPNTLKLTVLNPDCAMQECLGENLNECNPASSISGVQNSTAHAYANWLGVRFFDLDGKEITAASSREYETSYSDDEAWSHTGIADTTDCWQSETVTETEYTYTTECFSGETTGAETAAHHIASDEVLCAWAVSDYQAKTGLTGIRAEITSVTDDAYQITLTDESGKVAEVYTVDPITGIGTDSADEPVNLPQTGNNSLTGWITVSAALLLTGFGWYLLTSSGVIRRKEEENAKADE